MQSIHESNQRIINSRRLTLIKGETRTGGPNSGFGKV